MANWRKKWRTRRDSGRIVPNSFTKRLTKYNWSVKHSRHSPRPLKCSRIRWSSRSRIRKKRNPTRYPRELSNFIESKQLANINLHIASSTILLMQRAYFLYQAFLNLANSLRGKYVNNYGIKEDFLKVILILDYNFRLFTFIRLQKFSSI